MKIKEGYMLRSLGGQDIVVTIGEASKAFHGMIKLNESGAFLWKSLENGSTREELEQALTQRYQISKEQAKADVNIFLDTIKETGCILYD